jgi:hypothetical protein
VLKRSEPNARLLRRKNRDASRGSPRSFTAQKPLVQDDNALLLAFRAVVAAAAGDYYTLDGRFADQAELALAAVDAMLQLEETGFAVGVNII